jgi:hypothetical protein
VDWFGRLKLRELDLRRERQRSLSFRRETSSNSANRGEDVTIRLIISNLQVLRKAANGFALGSMQVSMGLNFGVK